jgi:3-hydroxybutyryl-CoA dehydrogenase
MELKEIRKALIVGSGTMGLQIAFQCAAHGQRVTLYDIDEAALGKAAERLAAYAEFLISGGNLESQAAEQAIDGIETMTMCAAIPGNSPGPRRPPLRQITSFRMDTT